MYATWIRCIHSRPNSSAQIITTHLHSLLAQEAEDAKAAAVLEAKHAEQAQKAESLQARLGY